MRHWMLGTVVAALAAIAGCNYHHDKTPKTDGNADQQLRDGGAGDAFALLNDQLFGPNCHACHNPGSARGGVDLTTYGSLRGARGPSGSPLIVAGKSADSELFQAISSGRMPPGSKKVSAELLQSLACWIDQGAPETGAGSCFAATETPDGAAADGTPDGADDKGQADQGGGDDGKVDHADQGGDDDGHGDHADQGDDGGHTDQADQGGDDGQADHGGDDGTQTVVKFSELQQKVLGPLCADCHTGERASAGIDLTKIDSVMSMKGRFGGDPASPEMLVVKPGSTAESLLWKVVTELEPTLPHGPEDPVIMRMPYYGDPISDDQKEMLRRWIEGGADRG